MSEPKIWNQLVTELEKLPGIGFRKANELAQHLVTTNPAVAQNLAHAIITANDEATICATCRADTDQQICPICADPTRNDRQFCVVGRTLDIAAIENIGQYQGRYHVLRGELDPLRGITPNRLEIASLLYRLAPVGDDPTVEVIIATDNTLNGEITASLVHECLRRAGYQLSISRIGSGIAIQQQINTSDPTNLQRALLNRDSWLPTEPPPEPP